MVWSQLPSLTVYRSSQLLNPSRCAEQLSHALEHRNGKSNWCWKVLQKNCRLLCFRFAFRRFYSVGLFRTRLLFCLIVIGISPAFNFVWQLRCISKLVYMFRLTTSVNAHPSARCLIVHFANYSSAVATVSVPATLRISKHLHSYARHRTALTSPIQKGTERRVVPDNWCFSCYSWEKTTSVLY